MDTTEMSHDSGQFAFQNTKPLVSVPNPKRSVPVNLLDFADEDVVGPFAEESYVLGSHRAIRSPIMELNPTKDATKPTIPMPGNARTPEIFDVLGQSIPGGFPSEQRSASRGVIGSARKVRSSASMIDDCQLLGQHSIGSASLTELLDTTQSLRSMGHSAQGGATGNAQNSLHRPSSTPATYSNNTSNALGSVGELAGDGRGGEVGDLSGAVVGLQLGNGTGPSSGIRGRDRDYSFGSLLGLTAQTAGSLSRIETSVDGTPLLQSQPAIPEGSSRGSSRASQPVFTDVAGDQWLQGQGLSAGGFSSREALRNSLSLGGTVSAPPLLNMYSYGYNSINNTSAFGTSLAAPSGKGSRFDPLAARYEGVVPTSTVAPGSTAQHGHGSTGATGTARQSPSLVPGPISSVAPSPQPFDAPPHPQPSHAQPRSAIRAEDRHLEAESVEGLVLRSCRDILSGAADHSLKAVELANTLRARVGTDALARIREKWGGLLALLEKHSGSFRVDRIPKNDKVTLLTGGSDPFAGALGPTQQQAVNDGPTPHSLSSGVEGQGSAHSSNHAHGGGATRCLHVGNVPANMTEPQLMREFEKFGQIEGLKLVSQRNGTRRFAFVTFQSVDQAVAARHALSKVHPWKSAISFAHKDYGGGPGGSGGLASNQQQHVHGGPLGAMTKPASGMVGGRPYTGAHDYQMNMLYQLQRQHQQSGGVHPLLPTHGGNLHYPFNMTVGVPYGAGPSIYWMPPPHAPHPVPGPFPMHAPYSLPQGSNAFAAVPAPSVPATTRSQDPDCPVLQRLCDDTYVPTQPWPADPTRDQPYCAAVVAQLEQFGGNTTVSKLRGYLRSRIAAVDNIKSVPLKAMLVAYPQYFILDGNYVHLASGAHASIPHPQQQMLFGAP